MVWIPSLVAQVAIRHAEAGVSHWSFPTLCSTTADVSSNAHNGPGRSFSCVRRDEGPVAYGSYVDEVLMMVNGSTKSYVHGNHLYSPAALTNAVGTVVERYRYDSYGKQTVVNASGTVLNKSAVGFDRGFTGYLGDLEAGLMHARARQYSPGLGRFIAQWNDTELDPNPYQYQWSDPANMLDPWGDPDHHANPLYLGGSDGQPLVPLSDKQHRDAHEYFRKEGFGPTDAGRENWKNQTDEQRKDHIKKSLKKAGVPDDEIDKNMDQFTKDEKPGKNRTKERGTENPRGSKRKRISRTGAGIALLIALSSMSEAAETSCCEGLAKKYKDLEDGLLGGIDVNEIAGRYAVVLEAMKNCDLPVGDSVGIIGWKEFHDLYLK